MDAVVQNGIALNPKSLLQKVDSTPTTDSENPVASGGVKTYVDQKDSTTNARVDTLGTQIAANFFFKGSSTYAALPSSGNTINDTYYVTDSDKECWYSWNGTDWIKSSMSQSDYAGLIAQLKADVSSEFSTAKTYNIGDYCLYGSDAKLYVCKTAITTTGAAWDSTKWQVVSFGDALSDIIIADDTQPTSIANKIWLDTDPAIETVEVITEEDLGNLIIAEFDSTSAYAIGDYALHNAKLYKAKTASAANDGWIANRWTQVTVMGTLNEEVGTLKTQLSAVFDEKSVGALISSIAGFTKLTGRSANVTTSGAYIGIKLTNTSGFDTYYMVLDKDISLSFDTTNTAYIALCTGEDYTDTVTDGSDNIYLLSSSPVRYRKSSGDLPTTTPLAISAGDAIAITLTADGDDYISGFTTELELKGDTFVEKTATKITVKLRDVELTVEKITNASTNLNVWRITQCKIGTYTVWLNQDAESVIQLLNEDDFIGGYHGNEQQTAIKIYLDNDEITENQVIENKEFSHLDILIESDLYHVDGGTKCFERDTILHFDKNGVKQYNTFKATENVDIVNWIVGMLSCENTDIVGDATGTPVLKTFFTNYEPFYHAIDTDIVLSKYNKNAVFITTKGTLEMTASAEDVEVLGRVRKYTSQSREKAYFYGINNQSGEAITSGTILSSSNTLTFA